MGKHDSLDDLLSRRAVPPMRSNLSERIIAQSLKPQKSSCSAGVLNDFSTWWADVLENILLPSPALALALVLVIGMALGVLGDAGVLGLIDNSDLTSSYLVLDENDLAFEELL